MKADAEKYLADILFSIQAINEHLEDINEYTEFVNSLKTMDAVERRLAIIGEALFQAEKLTTQLNITELKRIIKLRHILVHDYDLISSPTIWQIITRDLPLLKSEVETILNRTKS